MNYTVDDLYFEISEVRATLNEISESLLEEKSEDYIKIITISKRLDDLINRYTQMKKNQD